jgi:hypothetical protein
MALTKSFGYTNGTPTLNKPTVTLIGPVANYSVVTDDPGNYAATNKTSPMDQAEIVSYKCSKVAKVSTSIPVANPVSNLSGMQYVVKLEEILRIGSDTDPTFKQDLPIVAYFTLRHPRSSNITQADLDAVLLRLLGAVYKSDGTSRLMDLARGALKPTVD